MLPKDLIPTIGASLLHMEQRLFNKPNAIESKGTSMKEKSLHNLDLAALYCILAMALGPLLPFAFESFAS
jgi:hypothetical protein